MADKFLVITGASRGIGKATARLFLKEGWKVINISRTPLKSEDVQNFQIDLGKPGWKLEEIVKKKSRICLVHNAGAFCSDTIVNLDPAQFRTLMEVNVISPLLLNQLLLPKMDAGSSIIYIGSTLSEIGVPNTASYTILKHALSGAMKVSCQDLYARPEIHTCCVCPGFVGTQMLKNRLSKEKLMAAAKRVSKNRLVEPEEIASLISYCASNPSVNGSMIHANLGQLNG